MLKLLAAAVLLVTLASTAWAACPAGTRYMCTQGMNGKVVCGCY